MPPGIARLLGVLLGVVLGAGLGAAGLISIREQVTGGVIGVGVGIVVFTVVFYLGARSGSEKTSTEGAAGGEIFRTAMVGMNAALNVAILLLFLPTIAAVVIGAIPALAASMTISQTGVYQGILGWGNWLLPMSWPIVGLGFAFAVLNFLGTLFTLFLVDSWRVRVLVPEWSKGTIYFRAGWLANLNNQNTAFNMGNFTFVDFKSKSAYRDHEPLHGLSLAAFGSVFHLVGFVDEIILDSDNAYSERLADKVIPMWA